MINMKEKSLLITILATFISTFGGIWLFAEPLGFSVGYKLWVILIICSTVVTIGVVGIRLWINIPKQNRLYLNDQYVRINDPQVLTAHFSHIKTLRIFASGSETYRTLLLSFLDVIQLNEKLEIRILIRDDGSPIRKQKVSEAYAKWKNDIDSNFRTETVIRTYRSPCMLRGFIFDEKSAILGWYYSSPEGTQGQNIPAHVLHSDIENQKRVLDFSIRTFDYFFNNNNSDGE